MGIRLFLLFPNENLEFLFFSPDKMSIIPRETASQQNLGGIKLAVGLKPPGEYKIARGPQFSSGGGVLFAEPKCRLGHARCITRGSWEGDILPDATLMSPSMVAHHTQLPIIRVTTR